MSDFFETYEESDCLLDSALDELIALQELVNTPEKQELHLSESGREGLSTMLNRIATNMSTAQCNRPTADEIMRKISEIASESISNTDNNAERCGNA